MAQLYRVGNPIDREERANLNLTLDDILSRFSLMQSQINFLAGGADTEALIQEIRQAIADAEQATEDTEGAIANVDLKLQELEIEIEKAKDLKPVGEWNATTDYKKNNIVSKDGNSYIALVDNTNVDVTNTSTWQLSAAKGDKGDTGKGLTIKGTLDNPSQLPTTGDEGDAYYVGTDLYVWMVDHWENIGQIKGDPGSDADVTAANIELALGYVPADEGVFENFGMQYEFRVPTIVNRQIRTNKPSSSNRIPLLLNNDIGDGTAITVSLNSGATSLSLKNVDGTDVTKLEKGFIEIVQTGSFFTLRNKGGLNQADLDALITLTNEADTNDSTLRTEYVNAVNGLVTPPPLQSDASWNDILLSLLNVNDGKTGFRTGNKNSSSDRLSFETLNSNISKLYYYVTVPFSEIGFTPSKIQLFSATSSNSIKSESVYNEILPYTNESVRVYLSNSGELQNQITYNIKGTQEPAYVDNRGFRLPVTEQNQSYVWYAYE